MRERSIARLSQALARRLTARPALALAAEAEDQVLVEGCASQGVGARALFDMSSGQIQARPQLVRAYHCVLEGVLAGIAEPVGASPRASHEWWAAVDGRAPPPDAYASASASSSPPLLARGEPVGAAALVAHYRPADGNWEALAARGGLLQRYPAARGGGGGGAGGSGGGELVFDFPTATAPETADELLCIFGAGEAHFAAVAEAVQSRTGGVDVSGLLPTPARRAAERGAALAAADAFAAAHALPEAVAEALAEAHRPPAPAPPPAAAREGRSPAKRPRHHGGGPQPPA